MKPQFGKTDEWLRRNDSQNIWETLLLVRQFVTGDEPLNIRIVIDKDELALISEAAGSPHAVDEYMRTAAVKTAQYDLAGPPPWERTVDDMKQFCVTMLHVEQDSGEYRKAIRDVLFWLDHPGIGMNYIGER